jgi:hypothetical protein
MKFKNKKGATGFRNFLIGIVMSILFVFVMLSFVTKFLQQTNPTSPALTANNNALVDNANALNKTINTFFDLGHNIQTIFSGAKVTPTTMIFSIFLIFYEAFSIPFKIVGFFTTGIITLVSVMFPSLGGTGLEIIGVVMNIALAILIITGILLAIKMIRTGESEK